MRVSLLLFLLKYYKRDSGFRRLRTRSFLLHKRAGLRLGRVPAMSASHIRLEAIKRLCVAIDTFDVQAVREAARVATDATVASCVAIYQAAAPADEGGSPQDDASDVVEEFAAVLHYASEKTYVEGRQRVAEGIVTLLNRSLRKLGDDLTNSDLSQYGHENWDFCGHEDNGGFFTDDIPMGDANTALSAYFTKMTVWSGWCCKGDAMMHTIVSAKTPNTMQQALTTFAAVQKWPNVDKEWHDLVESSMFQNEPLQWSSDDADRDVRDGVYQNSVLCHIDPDTMLKLLSDPTAASNASVRSMFAAMRIVRNDALLRLKQPERMANTLAFAVGMKYVQGERSARYHHMWRRWFVLWSTASRWTKYVGERLGAPLGAIGLQLRQQFDVDMGDASGQP